MHNTLNNFVFYLKQDRKNVKQLTKSSRASKAIMFSCIANIDASSDFNFLAFSPKLNSII